MMWAIRFSMFVFINRIGLILVFVSGRITARRGRECPVSTLDERAEFVRQVEAIALVFLCNSLREVGLGLHRLKLDNGHL